MKNHMITAGLVMALFAGCKQPDGAAKGCCGCACGQGKAKEVRLVVLDPGHFHAALVLKQPVAGVSKTVHVYAPKGKELDSFMALIKDYNSRAENPTAWDVKLYTGDDYLAKMVAEKAGDVVVLAGNNARKANYILKSVEAGFNVLSDKPMAITPETFALLKKAFEVAKAKNVLLYDIMTERYEITTTLQRELSLFPKVYGTQEKGTPDDPAVTKESVHHFRKLVSGKPLIRPAWYYDTRQQGQAIVDVNTHLTDLVQWEVFPEKVLDPSLAKVLKARVWNTEVSLEKFTASTGATEWPEFLKKDVDAKGLLQCKANGEFTYEINGVFAKVSVLWNYQAPEGGGDTHYSLMRGSRVSLIIEQGQAEGYKPVLYVEPRRNAGVKKEEIEAALKEAMVEINKKWPGVSFEPFETGFRINVPKEHVRTHEANFNTVLTKYLGFLKQNKMPVWEVPNMLTKYSTLMQAYELANK